MNAREARKVIDDLIEGRDLDDTAHKNLTHAHERALRVAQRALNAVVEPPWDGHLITEDGLRIEFSDIARAIATLHPHLRGMHIDEQVEALGLLEVFQTCDSPVPLPFTFCKEEK